MDARDIKLRWEILHLIIRFFECCLGTFSLLYELKTVEYKVVWYEAKRLHCFSYVGVLT